MTTVILEITAKNDSTADVMSMLKTALPDTRAYDGCGDLSVHFNEDTRTFLLVEYWESKVHYERYLAWRKETGLFGSLVRLLEAEPKIRYFDATEI
jgi:quinol monooxygenase YgiN